MTRTSKLTGQPRTLDLPVSARLQHAIERGDVPDQLSPWMREFLRHGLTPEEWSGVYFDSIAKASKTPQ